MTASDITATAPTGPKPRRRKTAPPPALEAAALPASPEPLADDDAAREALTVAIAIMRAPTDERIRLAAARTVMEYTRTKPTQKTAIALSAAEALLDAVLADDDA